MHNNHEEKQAGRVAIVFAVVLIAAVAVVIFLFRLGVGGNIAQKGGAMIAATWQNLFGSASYDINSDDAIFGDDNASDTAISVATSTLDSSSSDSEGYVAPAIVKKATKKAVAPKTSPTSTPSTSSSQNSSGTQNPSPTPSSVPVVQQSTTTAPVATTTTSTSTATVVATVVTTTVATVAISTTTTTTATTTSGTTSTNSGGVSASDTSSSNSSTTQTTSTPTVSCSADHVVIAQVQIAGASSANDFVKLYNPTAAAIDMGGWRLRKKSSGGTDASLKVLGKGSSIAAGGYFTWANSAGGFALSITADVSSTETLAANNSVALMDASGTIIDEVAWGTGADQYVEGSAFPTNPAANQILERNAAGDAISDSDDNAADFALH